MDPALTILILLVGGLAMGAINSLAGAAGVIGLVVLEEAAGLSTMTANASLRPSALALGLAGWLGFRSRGHDIPRRAWLFGAMTVPGAVAGAFMTLALPAWVFRTSLLLVLTAVMVQQLRHRAPAPFTEQTRSAVWSAPMWFLLVGAHMGFLQVGTGLIAILALSALHSRDLVEVNAAKMALVICSAAAATTVLAVGGKIEWGPSLVVAAGCGTGAFLASRWSVAKGHGTVRIVILVITVVVLVRLVWQMLAGVA